MADDIELLRLRARAKAKAERERTARLQPELPQVPDPEPSTLDKLKEAGKTAALDYALPALDFAGGLMRAGGAGIYEAGKMAAAAVDPFHTYEEYGPSVVKEGDFTRILTGKAPSADEYLERAGIGKGAELSDYLSGMYNETGKGIRLQKGGWMDPSVRGTIGMALDTATDPLTYATLGGSAVAKQGAKAGFKSSAMRKLDTVKEAALHPTKPVGKAVEKTGELIESGGDMLSASGVKNVDLALKERGKRPLSEILIENRIWGTNSTIHDSLDKLSDAASATRNSLYEQATAAGASVKQSNVLTEFSAYTDAIRKKQGTEAAKDLANQLEEFALKNIPDVDNIPIQQASNIKSELRKNLPGNFYSPTGGLKPGVNQAIDELSSIYQRNIVREADKAVPGLGKEINDVNSRWGTIIESDSPVSKEMRKENRKNAITAVDTLGTGMIAATTGNVRNAAIVGAVKKATDVLNSTAGRTGLGRAMSGVGRGVQATGRGGGPLLDVLTRQQGIEAGRNRRRVEEPTSAPMSAWQNVKRR